MERRHAPSVAETEPLHDKSVPSARAVAFKGHAGLLPLAASLADPACAAFFRPDGIHFDYCEQAKNMLHDPPPQLGLQRIAAGWVRKIRAISCSRGGRKRFPVTNMSESTSKSAAELMWPWKSGGAVKAAPKSHLTMTLIQTVVPCAVASFLVFYKHHYLLGGVLYGLGALMLIAGLFVPPLHAAITRFGQWLGHVVGVGTTWLLLVPVYDLFVLPARVGRLLQGKDPLTRRLDRNARSSWTDRRPHTDDKHFLRQS